MMDKKNRKRFDKGMKPCVGAMLLEYAVKDNELHLVFDNGSTLYIMGIDNTCHV